MIRLIDFFHNNRQAVVRTCQGLLVALVVGSFLVDRSHAHTWPEHHIPFFWSLFGFCGAASIIGVARWLGRSGIQARENYYDCPFRKDDCPSVTGSSASPDDQGT